jgi:glutamate-1-semialdehyde 2,1-aminomutase
MSQVAPVGPVYQAGTLSGNPVAMAAGLAQLRLLNKHRDVYDYLARLGDYYRSGLREIVKNRHIDATVTGVGSLSCIFFTPEAVTDYDSAKTSDTIKFGRYFEEMLRHGMHLAPSQFEAIFFSAAHEKHHINQLLEAADTTFAILKKEERI